MRVLVVSHPSSVWGAQLRLLDTAPQLTERGIHLVLAGPRGDRFPEEWQARGLPFVPLDLPVHAGLRRDDGRRVTPTGIAREAVAVARSVYRIGRVARSFDVLLSFSLWAHLETAIAGRFTRTPVMMEVVDLVAPGLGQWMLALASRLASMVVVNSAATGKALGDADDIRVVHPGVDLGEFAPGERDEAVRASLGGLPDAPLVGIVGRVDPRKGVGTLVEAMRLVEHEQSRLVVVGDVGIGSAAFFDDLKRTAAAALGDRVHFAGRRADVADVLRALDVLVNASVAEPFGRSVLEAQATGLPVIGTASGGIPEFVENEITGLLVAPNEPEDLARALERLLRDEPLRRALGYQARQQAERRFRLDTRYDLLASFYRELVEQNERTDEVSRSGAAASNGWR